MNEWFLIDINFLKIIKFCINHNEKREKYDWNQDTWSKILVDNHKDLVLQLIDQSLLLDSV